MQPLRVHLLRKWQPIAVVLLRKFHGQRSLAGYSPWGLKKSDTTEQLALVLLHTHSIFCIYTLIDWIVDYFHILAIVNNIAIHVGMHIYIFDILVFKKCPLRIYPEMELLNYVVGFKIDIMISLCFQGKPLNIMVIQVYAPTSNTEEAEVEQFYEDLQDLLEQTPKKDVLFIIGDWNAKVGSQETPGVTGKFGLEYRMKQGKG